MLQLRVALLQQREGALDSPKLSFRPHGERLGALDGKFVRVGQADDFIEAVPQRRIVLVRPDEDVRHSAQLPAASLTPKVS